MIVYGDVNWRSHYGNEYQFSSIQSLSHVQLFVTLCTAACQASLSITNSWRLLRLKPIRSVMPSNHLILCHPLLLPPSIFPSIRAFSNESALRITWPEYWSFSFTINPSNEYSGLISFRMVWLDLLAVQGTLKGLLQHHSSEASVLQHSAFFIVQLSHPYMTTAKTIRSDQTSRSVVSDSFRPHELQHARPVHHHLPEFTQTHVHRVSDAIQPSHPLSSPSPPSPNPSQHQSLFQ